MYSQEDKVVTKTKIDLTVMVVALIVGGFYSVTSNPLMGVALLIGILSLWTVFPKLPVLQKIHIRK